MTDNYITWIILFFTIVGILRFCKDVFNILRLILHWSWSSMKNLYNRHPIRRACCKRFFKKYKADFETCDIMFNSDYKAMRNYVVKNRKKL